MTVYCTFAKPGRLKREARWLVSRSIEEPLSREILAGRLPRREHVVVALRHDAIELVRDLETI
jgi:hypothetical protein